MKIKIISLPNSFGFGGVLSTHGTDWSSGLTQINAGGTHEENPNEGVPSGVGEDGIPNLVEEGEVIWNNEYVFSDRLKVPEALANKYKLGGNKTFAEAIKEVTKESLTRPNDPISNETNRAIVNEFMDAQEALRENEQISAAENLQQSYDEDFMNQMAMLSPRGQVPVDMGGVQMAPQGMMNEGVPVEGMPVGFALGGRKFKNGSDMENSRKQAGRPIYTDPVTGLSITVEPDGSVIDNIHNAHYANYSEFLESPVWNIELGESSITADKPTKTDVKDSKSEKPVKGTKPVKDLNATTKDDVVPFKYRSTWERDVPIWAGLAGAFYGRTHNPDYSNADAIIDAARMVGTPVNIPVQTIGDYMPRRVADMRYAINLANQNRLAGQRVATNTAAGNRSMDLLGAMTLAHNNQLDLGEIQRQQFLAQLENDMKTAEFSRGTKVQNMSAINARNATQAQLNSHRQQAMLNGLTSGYHARQTIKDAWDNATLDSLNSATASIGAKGKENEEYNMMTSMAEHGYFPWYYGDRGIIQYVPQSLSSLEYTPSKFNPNWKPPKWDLDYTWKISKGGNKKKRRF